MALIHVYGEIAMKLSISEKEMVYLQSCEIRRHLH